MDRRAEKKPRQYQCNQCGASFTKQSLLSQHFRLLGHRNEFTCHICQKRFGRKDNLDRHIARHNDENQPQCTVCGKIFSRLDNLSRHKQEHHQIRNDTRANAENAEQVDHSHQIGGGIKRPADNTEQPESSKSKARRITKYDTPGEFYSLTKVNETRIHKFQTKATHYKVTFKDLEIRQLSNILTSLQRIFQSILENITQFIASNDLVRLSVECPELDFPISLPFMKRSELTTQRFLSEIERVLQSYEQFVLDSSLEIQLTHVKIPNGEGRKRYTFVNIDKMLKIKKCILRIENNDKMCCARALVTAKAKLEKHDKWESIRKGFEPQRQLALQLHEMATVEVGACGIQEIKAFQSVMKDYQIYVVSKEHFNAIVYQGPEADKQIYLYSHDDHYDIITSMPAFLNKNYFCVKCLKGYDHKEQHKCNNICNYCHKIHDKEELPWEHCPDCNRYFQGKKCFDFHKASTTFGNSTCCSYYRCRLCSQTINRKMHKKDHVCGEVYCKTCKDYFDEDHKCYMIPIHSGTELISKETNKKQSKDDDPPGQTYIFYDLECTQDDQIQCEEGFKMDSKTGKCQHCSRSLCGSYEHQPNLCVVHKVCTTCLQTDVTAKSRCNYCGQNEMIFSGSQTINNFCRWLFSEQNTNATVLCHNFKGYDSYPVLKYLYQNGILPKVIPNGAKNMSVEVTACKIRMIDSINFLPAALSKLPEMFGIEELAKGYFPHLFNRKENQDSMLTHLPALQYYNHDAMKEKDREAFLEWYNLDKNQPFNFKEELLKYCKSDVDILRRCCLKFRSLFMNMTSSGIADQGIDPFASCITIASACNLVFRTKFLESDTIGIIPAQGYRPEEKQSIKALQWIQYMAVTDGRYIQHARNGGEKMIGPFKADGYFETETEKVVLEFHGCFWHGCPKCYSGKTMNPIRNITMGDLLEETLDKKRYIENEGYVYRCKWECEFDKEIADNERIREYINQTDIVTPLEPRDAFYGGRTEAFRLYTEASENTKINYYDVTSLYPFINKTGKAVLGHPHIITENFDKISNYEGLIKCVVLPPRKLHIPVLPLKINGKLLFALCKTCAESKQQACCQHTATERALVGTWVTDEIKKALELGYTILRIYEVWHFEKVEQYDPKLKQGGLFTGYVNKFLKLKQEADGWPDWCLTEEDKQTYIRQYHEKEGILLEHKNIQKNKGLRALAKLMLNSFWGKFGQRSNMLQVEYVTDPAVYFELLTSDKQEVTDVKFVSDEMVEMRWRNTDEFVEASGRTNVVIAAYTTAQARLKLYSYLEKLGTRALYADTDSVVFTTKGNEWEPPLGVFLGDLTDETPKNKILSFVAAGPKNYAYNLSKPDKDGMNSICKVRGISLNFKNSLSVNFDTICDMVKGASVRSIPLTDKHKIVRDQMNCRIVTTNQDKDYRIVFDKRVISDNYQTYPYGY